ncbi:MAG: Ig-like domain-containing protein, partial [Phycisphaerales bacterium]|nr:Ig-like domain-containing protein [Phycisphaerales bacterium]
MLTITATSSNPGLIPNPAVSYTSPQAAGTLTLTPVANANGTATITVVASDDGATGNGGVNSATRTFTVTVAPVNDPPVMAAIVDPAPVLEGVAEFDVNLSGISAGPSDERQVLVVGATSSNPALVPNPIVSYSSPQATGTLTFAPVIYGNGTSVITLVVADDGGTANGGANLLTNRFTVTVTAVNDGPTLAPIPDPEPILENAGDQTVALSGLGAGPGENQVLTVTVTSSDPSLIANPIVNYVSPNSTGTLTYRPVANASGRATISVQVADNGGSDNGGANAVMNTFTVVVLPVNNRPTLDPIPSPAPILEESGTQTIALTGISAGVEENQVLTVTATSSNPALISNPTVNYSSPNATGTLSYRPTAGSSGTATISVVVTDDGDTLNGGANTLTREFVVVVTPVNDRPAISTIADQSTV